MSKGKYIKDLTISESINDLFVVTMKSLNVGKNSREYLSLRLSDKTGDIEAKKWETSEAEAEQITEGQVYLVKGTVNEYNQAPQIRVDKISRTSEKVNPADFMKSSPRDLDEMLAELRGLVDSVRTPEAEALLRYFFDDPKFMDKFRYAPAAISMHHGYISGLLEHTLQVAATGLAISGVYPVNRDVVMCGCLLHDIAKTTEYSWSSSIEFTTEGHLLGHLYRGAQMVREACEKLGLNSVFSMHMEHMILSHHGKYEWCSPKRPKSAEAMILFIADYTSASLTQMRDAVEEARVRNEKGDFTRKAKSLDRRIYKGGLLGPESLPEPGGDEDKPEFSDSDNAETYLMFGENFGEDN